MKNITQWHSNIFQTDFIYKTNIKNGYNIPKIKNISLNICSKSIIENPKNIIYILLAIKFITNQNPTVCTLKKSIPTFKLRQGMLIGSKVNLSSSSRNFNHFFYMVAIYILPNLIKPKLKFQKNESIGSIAINVNDLSIFPQINCWYDKFPKNVKSTINISTTSTYHKYTKLLLTSLQVYF